MPSFAKDDTDPTDPAVDSAMAGILPALVALAAWPLSCERPLEEACAIVKRAMDLESVGIRLGSEALPGAAGLALPFSASNLKGSLVLVPKQGEELRGAGIAHLMDLAGAVGNIAARVKALESEMKKRRERVILEEVSKALIGNLDLHQVLGFVLEGIAGVIEIASASMILMDGGKAVFYSAKGFDPDTITREYPSLEGLPYVRRILDSGESLLIPDTTADPDWVRIGSNDYIKSWLGVPLVVQGKSIGLLTLDHGSVGAFGERETGLAQEFAARAAVAIEKSILHAKIVESEERYRRIFEGTDDYIFSLDRSGLIIEANPAAVALSGADGGLKGLGLASLCWSEADRAVLGESLAGPAGSSRREIALKRHDGTRVEALFELYPSLDASGTLAGFQGIAHDITERKAAERLREARGMELERLVAERTRALEEANRRLKELSWTDALTGLANRRRLDEYLAAEWSRASRAGHALGFAMVDVDHFKKYNDRYGHQAGDDCLATLAGVLRGWARRASDLAARYGGEEFSLVVPETDEAHMRKICEGIIATLAELSLPHELSSFGRVTASIGCAVLVPPRDSSPELIVKAADSSLYEAKNSGRNTYRVH